MTKKQAVSTGRQESRNAEARVVEYILSARRQRNAVFGDTLFSDPAWDILLTLYLAHLRGERLATSALCFASGVPMSTALRHFEQLAAKGWIERIPDARHGRRVFIDLTDRGAITMRQWFIGTGASLLLERTARTKRA